jgi:hypothetical protein
MPAWWERGPLKDFYERAGVGSMVMDPAQLASGHRPNQHCIMAFSQKSFKVVDHVEEFAASRRS